MPTDLKGLEIASERFRHEGWTMASEEVDCAIAEIKDLRAKVSEFDDTIIKMAVAQDAEIKRLQDLSLGFSEQIHGKDAEIAKLRERCEELEKRFGSMMITHTTDCNKIAALEAQLAEKNPYSICRYGLENKDLRMKLESSEEALLEEKKKVGEGKFLLSKMESTECKEWNRRKDAFLSDAPVEEREAAVEEFAEDMNKVSPSGMILDFKSHCDKMINMGWHKHKKED